MPDDLRSGLRHQAERHGDGQHLQRRRRHRRHLRQREWSAARSTTSSPARRARSSVPRERELGGTGGGAATCRRPKPPPLLRDGTHHLSSGGDIARPADGDLARRRRARACRGRDRIIARYRTSRRIEWDSAGGKRQPAVESGRHRRQPDRIPAFPVGLPLRFQFGGGDLPVAAPLCGRRCRASLATAWSGQRARSRLASGRRAKSCPASLSSSCSTVPTATTTPPAIETIEIVVRAGSGDSQDVDDLRDRGRFRQVRRLHPDLAGPARGRRRRLPAQRRAGRSPHLSESLGADHRTIAATATLEVLADPFGIGLRQPRRQGRLRGPGHPDRRRPPASPPRSSATTAFRPTRRQRDTGRQRHRQRRHRLHFLAGRLSLPADPAGRLSPPGRASAALYGAVGPDARRDGAPAHAREGGLSPSSTPPMAGRSS